MKQINLFRWISTFPCKVIANHASISHDSGICGDFPVVVCHALAFKYCFNKTWIPT